ncbi:MAG: hypothetical protein ACXWVM_31960 [Polyangiales bacterium]
MSNTPRLSNDTNDIDLETISPLSNVLPKGAAKDEVDIHWHFNWAEADLAPTGGRTLHEQALLGRRVSSTTRTEVQEPSTEQLRAADRSSRVRRALTRIEPRHVSALARWSAPPTRIPEEARTLFGRLAGVMTLTPSFDEMGGTDGFLLACRRAQSKREKSSPANFLRHRARVTLALVAEEAEALIKEAFAAYRAAVVTVDEENEALARMRNANRAPALTRMAHAAPAANDARPAGALARLRARTEAR